MHKGVSLTVNRGLLTALVWSVNLLWCVWPPAAHADGTDEKQALARSIQWQSGPAKGSLGSWAEITVPEGFMFADPGNAMKFLELCENIPDPNTAGILQPTAEDESWFLAFEYNETGHVKDDEKSGIDADALLRQMQANEVAANEARQQRGFQSLFVRGWIVPPAYETDTRRLAWAMRLQVEDANGEEICNYNVRLLGRTGVMSATLVCDPKDISRLVPQVKGLLQGFDFMQGQRYGEWRSGDKVAAYGLTGLITGGAAVVAAKSGLFAKLAATVAKMGKAIIIAVIALLGGAWKMVTGKRASSSSAP